MLDGAFALLERSLRLDARSRSTHLIRMGLMGAIYFSLCSTLITGSLLGAPGLQFFQSIVMLDVGFLTLAGISFFSLVITEEKEEDTLGLMLMAGISPLGILVGKSLGGLWQAILLIVVQYPFILLSVTMGGVTQGQVWAVTVALLTYVVFLAGLGLLCSTISPRSKTAAWLMGAALLMYFAIPTIATELSMNHARRVLSGEETWNLPDFVWMLLEGIGGVSISFQLDRILSTGFVGSAWSTQVISNTAMGAISLGLARLVFDVATRSPSTEINTRGLVASRRGFFRFAAGRAWSNPFIWKDFHFVSGGVGMTLIRIALFIGLGLIPFVAKFLTGRPADGDWIAMSIGLMIFSSSIGAASVLARSMNDEVRGQTLASLMMLPRRSAGIVYSKFAGALLGWVPGVFIGPFALLTCESVRQGLLDMTDLSNKFPPTMAANPMYLLSLIVVGFLICVLFYALTPHFAALLALYMRWGAVPLAIGLTFAVYLALIISITTLAVLFSLNIEPAFVMVAIAAVLFCLCGTCHVGILLRVEALAAK